MSKGKDLEEIKSISSYQNVFRQCQRNLKKLGFTNGQVDFIQCSSTGDAAKKVSEGKDSMAAIATEKAADFYKLNKLVETSIADYTETYTRFWILGRKILKETENVKTAFLFDLVNDKPSALYDVLRFFAKEKISLEQIYQCPIPYKKWEYTYLVELSGNIKKDKMRNAYSELSKSGLCKDKLKYLGSYYKQ